MELESVELGQWRQVLCDLYLEKIDFQLAHSPSIGTRGAKSHAHCRHDGISAAPIPVEFESMQAREARGDVLKELGVHGGFVDFVLDILNEWSKCIGNIVNQSIRDPVGRNVNVILQLLNTSPDVLRMRCRPEMEL